MSLKYLNLVIELNHLKVVIHYFSILDIVVCVSLSLHYYKQEIGNTECTHTSNIYFWVTNFFTSENRTHIRRVKSLAHNLKAIQRPQTITPLAKSI